MTYHLTDHSVLYDKDSLWEKSFLKYFLAQFIKFKFYRKYHIVQKSLNSPCTWEILALYLSSLQIYLTAF